MKRTPLRRRTPLKAKSGFKSRQTQLKQTPLKRTGQRQSGSTLKSISDKRQQAAKGPIYSTFKNGGRGLKGHGRTADDIAFHDRVVKLGCIACRRLNQRTHFPVRIHHIDGRNKGKSGDYSERKVLPLCDEHHDPLTALPYRGVTPDIEAPSVHGRKKLFVAMVGTEESLVLKVYELLGETPPWLHEH